MSIEGTTPTEQIKSMNKLLTILLIILLTGCAGMYDTAVQDKSTPCPPCTNFKTNIPNNDRSFGNSPIEWSFSLEFYDNTGKFHRFLFTEKEMKMYLERESKNVNDK